MSNAPARWIFLVPAIIVIHYIFSVAHVVQNNKDNDNEAANRKSMEDSNPDDFVFDESLELDLGDDIKEDFQQYKINQVFDDKDEEEEEERDIGPQVDSVGYDIDKKVVVERPSDLVEKELDQSEIINPFQFEALIEPTNPCASPDTFIFFYIYTSPGNAKDRQLVRETWLNLSLYPKTKIGYVFLMGLEEDRTIPSEEVRREAELFDDILVESYVDSYRNLTRKGVSGMRYVMNHCSHVRRIVRCDDDVLIDVFHLISYFQSEDPSFNKGVFICRFQPSSPIRDTESKWYVTWEDWPQEDYPPVCNGFIYIMSPDVSALLYKTSLTTRYFYFEDVYITGSLVQKANVSRVNVPRFYDGKFWRFNNTLYATPRDQEFPVMFTLTHKNTAEEVREVWQFIVDKYWSTKS